MNAFVINEEQLKKVGLVMAGVVVAVFIAGYYLGSKQLFSANENAPLAVNDEANAIPATDASLVSPVGNKSLKDNSKVNKAEKKNEVKKINKKEEAKKSPAKNNASKKTENKKTPNKKPEVKAVNKNTSKSVKKTTEKKVTSNNITNKKTTPKKQTVKKNNKEQDKKAPVLANGAVKPDAVKNDGVKEGSSKIETAKIETAKNDPAKVNSLGGTGERIYSIQAGMFSSETNANAFIEKLSAKQFDAFISGFVSSSGATKYNVRIGKFSQRDQARELLQEFQKSFSSPAYVVISKP